MNGYDLDVNKTRQAKLLHAEFTWPGPLPDLTDKPLLYGCVTTPHDQAALHRELARLGYVPDRLAERDGCDWWRWYHPDGQRPTWDHVVVV